MSARSKVCDICKERTKRGNSREVRLKEAYGINEEIYRFIFNKQGGVCAICGKSRRYNLDVDHSHALEASGIPLRDTVRGLLCKVCNRHLLRSVRDNPAILRAAADYLENPPAPQAMREFLFREPSQQV